MDFRLPEFQPHHAQACQAQLILIICQIPKNIRHTIHPHAIQREVPTPILHLHHTGLQCRLLQVQQTFMGTLEYLEDTQQCLQRLNQFLSNHIPTILILNNIQYINIVIITVMLEGLIQL